MRSHFLSPTQIAQLFPKHLARVRTEWEGFSSWVIVEKVKQ
jgi:hypothetical protein